MREIGDHAVVLGTSMGGLLAARVLADAYQRVTVVERDRRAPGDGRFAPGGHLLCLRGPRHKSPPSRSAGPTWKATCAPGSGRCPRSRSSTGAT
jgi:choline dehydrogenase-like flavoprotein